MTVAYYDYQKVYGMVKHNWIVKVYKWFGIPEKVIQLIIKMMTRWKKKLDVTKNGEKIKSTWINISRGLLQGDSYFAVGFCINAT